MTDQLQPMIRPGVWGGMFDAPPSGSVVCRAENIAAFSKGAREFRYAWAKCWDATARPWMWVMINPADADECETDRTVDRCLGFAERLAKKEEEPVGGLVIVNLFAYHDKNPAVINRHSSRHVGPENDKWIELILESDWISKIIAAWGDDGHFTDRRKEVEGLLRGTGIPIFQIGSSTQCGAPRHMSPRARAWLPDDAPLVPYYGDAVG